MKKVLPKVKRIINMSLKQAKFYGDDVVRIEHIVISLINDYNNNAIKTLLKLGVDVDKLHKTIEKKHIINNDLLIWKLGQNVSKKIIIINEKLPERWPDNKEKKTLIKIKNRARVLYFKPKKSIKKEIQKNKIPILWINGPFNGFLNGHWKELWSVKILSIPINK